MSQSLNVEKLLIFRCSEAGSLVNTATVYFSLRDGFVALFWVASERDTELEAAVRYQNQYKIKSTNLFFSAHETENEYFNFLLTQTEAVMCFQMIAILFHV